MMVDTSDQAFCSIDVFVAHLLQNEEILKQSMKALEDKVKVKDENMAKFKTKAEERIKE